MFLVDLSSVNGQYTAITVGQLPLCPTSLFSCASFLSVHSIRLSLLTIYCFLRPHIFLYSTWQTVSCEAKGEQGLLTSNKATVGG